MTGFTLYDAKNAPEASLPLLEKSKQAFGRLPGLHRVMAEAPGLLEGYQKSYSHLLVMALLRRHLGWCQDLLACSLRRL